jgi:hypothetical protein
LFVFLSHCTNKNEQYSPIFKILEREIEQDFITDLKTSKEKHILLTHFARFFYEYKEIVKKNKEIEFFFEERGLKQESEQAYVLLLLWYRKLNNKELNMPELLKMAGDERIGVNSCRIVRKINSVDNFMRLSLGDKVGLKFTYSEESGKNIKSAAYYGCPIIYWDFDNSKDIYIEGCIVNKYSNYSPKDDYLIQVKVTHKNHQDSYFLYRPSEVGDTIEVDLESYGMKI